MRFDTLDSPDKRRQLRIVSPEYQPEYLWHLYSLFQVGSGDCRRCFGDFRFFPLVNSSPATAIAASPREPGSRISRGRTMPSRRHPMSATPSVSATTLAGPPQRTALNRQQVVGFWAAWAGWTLDGMDSVIYALVLSPALTELLPKSGMESSLANIGRIGSIMFALFLIGWGLSFIWGPVADRFGRTRTLAATILIYARVHRRGGIRPGHLATRRLPLPCRHRHRRRMGDGRHLCRRGLAGGPPQDGRGLPADRLLLRLLPGRRAQLHGWRELRLAGDVPLRHGPGGGLGGDAAQREGAPTLAAQTPGRGTRARRPPPEHARADLPAALSRPHDRHVRAALGCRDRAVGRRRL